MADPVVQIPETAQEPTAGDDVDMGDDVEITGVRARDGAPAEGAGDDGVEVKPEEAAEPPRMTFVDYLASPIVELLVASGEDQRLLYAHQALLVQSPYFAEACSQFTDTATRRRIELATEDLDAMASFLSYLYTGEYFPKRLSPTFSTSALESDPSLPSPDNAGVALLKHARVYTLATRMGLPALRSLAHAKIHNTTSTAKGEIAYARYVYGNTDASDVTIRRPVAAFWATRSHVLRHQAEEEFRELCLEFPQFGFDVLSLVLDQKEKGKERGGTAGSEGAGVSGTPGHGSSRKRARGI